MYISKKDWLSELCVSLRNLFLYFKAVWKDRDYSNKYMFKLLEFKVKKQIKFLEKNPMFVRNLEDLRDLKIIYRLLNVITEDYYMNEYLQYSQSNTLQLYYDKNKGKYRSILKKSKRRLGSTLLGLYIMSTKQEQAKKLLFKLLENKVKLFWL